MATQIIFQFLIARTGQYAYNGSTDGLNGFNLSLINLPRFQFIKVRVPNQNGIDALLTVPSFFEWKITQHPIHKATHFGHTPTSPSPKLRRNEVHNRNAKFTSLSRNPPVKTWEIDQYNNIWSVFVEKPPNLIEISSEVKEPLRHHQETNNRQLTYMNQRFDSRGHHAITTKPRQIDGRIQQLQGFCKICAMKITAWFASCCVSRKVLQPNVVIGMFRIPKQSPRDRASLPSEAA